VLGDEEIERAAARLGRRDNIERFVGIIVPNTT
jgi:hypothetical protein